MAFGPTLDDIRSNAKQTWASHVSAYSALPLTPQLSPSTTGDDPSTLNSDVHSDQTIGRRLSYCAFCLCCHDRLILPVVLSPFLICISIDNGNH